MTSFWRPVDASGQLAPAAWRTKRVGPDLYALWGRCDVCFVSRRFDEFTAYERGDQVGTLCPACQSDPQLVFDLVADGWAPWA